MNVCPYCQELVRIEQPRKIVDLQVYHLHCGFKQEKENEDNVRKNTGGSNPVQPK